MSIAPLSNSPLGLSLIRALVIVASALHLTACSKSVSWDEEVLLNTGKPIVVRRSVTYSLQGGAGNPFDFAYRPEREQAIEFEWDGRKYRYEGDARIMTLAISPQNVPVLVAKAADNSWDAVHNYQCTLPYYVQLVPQGDGKTWTWPRQIESWLYGLPKNLMLSRHAANQMRSHYSIAAAKESDATAVAGIPSSQKIDPTYVGDKCQQQRRK